MQQTGGIRKCEKKIFVPDFGGEKPVVKLSEKDVDPGANDRKKTGTSRGGLKEIGCFVLIREGAEGRRC